MFTVKKKTNSANIVWDVENNRPLCKFVNGVYTTNNKDIADKLKALGYTVTGKAESKTDGAADDA